MRALEVGRPLLRVANTGISAFIDHRGGERSRLDAGRTGTLELQVTGMKGLTPYARWGDLPVLLAIALAIATGIAASRTTARARPLPSLERETL